MSKKKWKIENTHIKKSPILAYLLIKTILFFTFFLPVICLLFVRYVSLRVISKVTERRFDLRLVKFGWKTIGKFNQEIKNLLTDYFIWLMPQEKENIMKALNPKATHEYVCKEDKKLDENDQTVFVVKYLSIEQSANIRDNMYQVDGSMKNRKERILAGTSELEVLKLGLKGWKNFRDELTGEKVDFDDKNIMEMIGRIPPAARTELADHIRGESTLSEGEF